MSATVKGHLVTFALALAAIWVANNVKFVGDIVQPK